MDKITSNISKWISIHTLNEIIDDLITKSASKKCNYGIVDPFKKSIDCYIFNIKENDYLQFEQKRILDKSISMNIGYFHENVLKNCIGWKSTNEKYMDLCNVEETIYIQLKNKYNTLNSTAMRQVHKDLLSISIKYSCKTYLGIIIDKKPKKKVILENVGYISGKYLFELVTSDINAFDDLLEYFTYYIECCQ